MRKIIGEARVSRSLVACALFAAASWACTTPSTIGGETGEPTGDKPNVPTQNVADGHKYDPNSIIVKFKSSANKASHLALKGIKANIKDGNKDGVDDRFANIANGQLALVELDKSEDVTKVIEQLRANDAVEYAEYNWIVSINATPNDPRFDELYGLHNTGQTGGTDDADIDATEAWDLTIGDRDIVVGVVDTGVDYNHEDLAANMWTNPGEIAGNGIDDDDNGVIDDVHGYNAITDSGDPMDDNDHGSHCSGTIGGVGNNGIGVAGVNHEVSIMGLKFLSAGGSGSTAGAIAAIDYAVNMKVNHGVNLRVLSNSWGGGGFSQALADSIEAANAADILFIAAAGNSSNNNDSNPHYPSSYENTNVVAVAATDHNDNMASFSSFGATSVDLAAPGVNVVSTIPGGYASFSGTSMATPHVAGVAALVLSNNQTLTVAELKAAIMDSVDPKDNLAGLMVTGGRLNAEAAVFEAGPPVPRFNLAVSPGSAVVVEEGTATYTIDVTSIAGYTGNVDLSLDVSPAFPAGSTTVTGLPTTVTAPGTATVTVTTSQDTVGGNTAETFSMAITGSDASNPDLDKTRNASLQVRPFGTVEVPFPSPDTPIDIPDNDPTGITSTITVTQPITIQELQIDVNITHTFIGDLQVTLHGPPALGLDPVILHDRAGGGTDNLNQTFTVTAFNDLLAVGDWTLHVADFAGADTGTLDDWTIRVIGVVGSGTFGLSASPDSQRISQGDSAEYAIDVEAFGDFDRDVVLTALPSAPVLITTIDPDVINTAGSATLTVGTSMLTPPGTYSVTVTGTDGVDTYTDDVEVVVDPFGTIVVGPIACEDTPIDIPDNNAEGINCSIEVPDSLTINEMSAQLDITHTFIGDIVATLSSPAGTEVILHNGTGGGADDLHEVYNPTEYNGEDSRGTWNLHVRDRFFFDTGSLDNIALTFAGTPNDLPPTADFTYEVSYLDVSFTDASSDDSAVVAWAWDFGDGNTSADQNPTNSYAAPGTYTVCLTVTDDGGQTGSTCQDVDAARPPPLLWIERVTRDRDSYEFTVDFGWTGAEGGLVEFYQNGLLWDIPDNDGASRHRFRQYETSYAWWICEQFSDFCSNEVSIVFGATANPDELKLVQKVGDITTEQIIKVEIVDEK